MSKATSKGLDLEHDDADDDSCEMSPAVSTGMRLSPRPGFLSALLFFFIAPVVRHARREGDVQAADLFFPKAVLIDRVHGLFEAAWLKSLKAGKPNIIKAVVANSFWGLISTGLLYAVSLAAQLVGPLMLQRIVAGLQCWGSGQAAAGSCPTTSHLYYYVIAISLSPLIQSLTENQMQYQLNVVGLKMRNGLMAAIYRKCLRLSNAALQSESTGRVVTLMSNDAQKVQDVTLAIHTLWGAPLLILVILGLLYLQMGWATFVGLIIVVVFSPISTTVSARLVSLRRSLMVWTDKRVGLMNEIINSMQMIKFMAWETPFKAAVMDVRSKEAGILRSIIWWQSLFVMLLFSGPVLMAVVVFAVYALTGHVFGAANAYTSLALFNLLRMPLAFLPIMITACINALVALNRIGDFLQKPESGLEALRQAAQGTPVGHVKVSGGVFSWGSAEPSSDSSNAFLQDINFEAKPGSLTLVVGSVASGKSSLLSALIGQMERLQGSVGVGGRVAYVAQTAWIINDSVQENIVMGESFEPSRYRVAAEASQLMPDLALWPDGDATEIGDRGVTLSGGQKQRVSIARAVYADADTYLLDDPLSAVDTHVGRALFEECIRGVLRNKTVILVTNALQHLPAADHVIWMDNGRIRAQGRYQELIEAGLNIAELHLEDHSSKEEQPSNASSTLGDGDNEDEFAAAVPSEPTSSSTDWEEEQEAHPDAEGSPLADASSLAAAAAVTGRSASASSCSTSSSSSSRERSRIVEAGPCTNSCTTTQLSSDGNSTRTSGAPASNLVPSGEGLTPGSSAGSLSSSPQQHLLPTAAAAVGQGGLLRYKHQQHAAAAAAAGDASSDAEDSCSGVATVVVQPTRRHNNSNNQQQNRQQVPQHKQQQPQQQQSSQQLRSAGQPPLSFSRDLASAGSVSGAALKVAASKLGPPASLSMFRLAAEANRNLTGTEEKQKGSISGLVLKTYIMAAGGVLVALSVVAVMAVEQASRVVTDTFLGWWASDRFHQSVWFYVGIYTALGLFYSGMTFVRVCWFMWTTVTAAVELHNRLLAHILRLPKIFFDTNPAGRVLNRFSRDVETMDSVLNQSMVQCCNCFATYIAILFVISFATKWFAISILPITTAYVLVQRYYIPTARELQRLESVTRSPIYSKFSEALAGVATIRAYCREAYFTCVSDSLMELNAAAFVSQRAAAGWLAVRLDLVGVVVVTLTAVLSISGGISPALAGLSLVYALDLTRFLKYGTALAAKTESDFNSVERIVQYLLPPTEAAEDTPPDIAAKLPHDWPPSGSISVQQLVLRYRPGLPLVLRGVSFEVEGGDKVGLVGRTGSGKSSLLLALFRMVEPESGSILIDGVDISTLGLKQLRSQMSIIPQEPFLFSGTVRSNLDPFNTYEEAELWHAVSAVGLKEAISALNMGLDAHVVDGGNNFSQGQKQLFCLARAILRNSRVLMLDEATASVDPQTDALIQRTIRSSFADTTMLTIAHRLNTIMDADRVLVLDQGMLVESGEPHELLQHNAGIFTGMVAQTGSNSAAYLHEVARQASMDRAASRSSRHSPWLRQQSELLGRRYLDDSPVVDGGAGRLQGPGGDEEDGGSDGRGVAGRGWGRVGSELAFNRMGFQDPMAGCLATGGAAFTRELSLLQRNAEAEEAGHTRGLAGAVVRHLPGLYAAAGLQQNSTASSKPHTSDPHSKAQTGRNTPEDCNKQQDEKQQGQQAAEGV